MSQFGRLADAAEAKAGATSTGSNIQRVAVAFEVLAGASTFQSYPERIRAACRAIAVNADKTPVAQNQSAFVEARDNLRLVYGDDSFSSYGPVNAMTAILESAVQWTPTQVTTNLWLDASDLDTITHIDGAVSGLADKSNVGTNDVAQTTASRKPTTGSATIGGTLNALVFDGDAFQFLSVANNSSLNFDSSDGFGLYAVLNHGPYVNRGSTANVPFSKGSPYFGPAAWGTRLQTNSKMDFKAGIDRAITPDDEYSDTDLVIAGTSCISSTMQVYTINGGNKKDTSTAGCLSDNTDAFVIGQQDGVDGRSCDLKFGEIIMIPGPQTESGRQIIEGYLAWKWNLVSSLPSTHPYKLQPPYVTGS